MKQYRTGRCLDCPYVNNGCRTVRTVLIGSTYAGPRSVSAYALKGYINGRIFGRILAENSKGGLKGKHGGRDESGDAKACGDHT